MTRALPAFISLLVSCLPAAGMVGGARTSDAANDHVVMIIGQRGNVCTGTALARGLVLTAAHCVAPASTYRVVSVGGGVTLSTRGIAVHPGFDPRAYAASRATADVALIALDGALPASVVPAPLGGAGETAAAGQPFVVAGVGVTVAGGDAGIGVARAAHLVATGHPGALQLRLVDAASRNGRAGLGACTGDSGGPAFHQRPEGFAVIGVVSWSTGPGNAAGCGGLTGVTPIARYRSWIVETARKFGHPLR